MSMRCPQVREPVKQQQQQQQQHSPVASDWHPHKLDRLYKGAQHTRSAKAITSSRAAWVMEESSFRACLKTCMCRMSHCKPARSLMTVS